jgi:hypothetical protein
MHPVGLGISGEFGSPFQHQARDARATESQRATQADRPPANDQHFRIVAHFSFSSSQRREVGDSDPARIERFRDNGPGHRY